VKEGVDPTRSGLLREGQGIIDPGQGCAGVLPFTFELGEKALVEGQIEVRPQVGVCSDCLHKVRHTRFALAKLGAGPAGMDRSVTVIERHLVLFGEF
jgi:hypothetical protein